ncbi:MAG: hypothetical protein N3E44_05530 [Candidatus Bathyarchaeota archaeon]|nr:hypothetical protein [Candidatus Bathyarchaeota archaeon]
MKIYTLFLGKGEWGPGWPYIGYDEKGLCESIVRRLRDRFPDIEFVGGRVIWRYSREESWEVKRGLREADGLLLCIVGNYGTNPMMDNIGVEAIEIGKPTILVSFMYGGDWGFIRIYERVRGRGFPVLPISSPNFEDMKRAIGVMKNLYDMRGRRILVITFDKAEVSRSEEDKRRLTRMLEAEGLPIEVKNILAKYYVSPDSFTVDVHGVDQAIQWRRNEDLYRSNLKSIFGLELVRIDPDELLDYWEDVSVEEAGKVADEWVNEAEEIRVPRDPIVGAARLYLALKKLLKDKGCDAVGIECFPVLLSGKMPILPCMAFSKLNDEGIVAACEADMDSAVTLLLGKYLAGRPGMIGNYCLDLSGNKVTYLHCTSPTKLHGYGGSSLSYYIDRHGEAHFIGASPIVRFPQDEPVTTVKVSVFHRSICIRYGRSLGLLEDEKACRNKLVVEDDANRILEKHDQSVFGWHKVSFLGDLRWEFEAAARLLSLKVVKDDR